MTITPSPYPIRRAGLLLALCALLWSQAALPGTARAAGVVGNGSPGSCTEAALRAAVAGGGKVSFNCGPEPATITLSDTLELSQSTVEIDGGGKVTLSGGGKVRVIFAERTKLTLRNLTIRDGRSHRGGGLHVVYYSEATVENVRFINNTGTAGTDEAGGGGIAARVTQLTVRDSYFEGNTGINGGAIHSLTGGLVVERSTFVNNDALAGGPLGGGFGSGGAIYTDGATYPVGSTPGGKVVIRDSSFTGNRAAAQGGAVMTFVYPPQDTVLIEGSIFEGNSVTGGAAGQGAGGAVRHGNGPITLRNSLFAGNSVIGSGGAFWSGRDFASRIENVTFVENRATSPDSRSGMGGALFIADGEYSIVNSTLLNNYAQSSSGAILAANDRVALFNTIVAGNWSGDGTRIWNQCSRALSGGGNSIQTPSRATRDGGDYPCARGITFADPKLGALSENGGPFRTVPLLAGSPAIDAGASCPAADARGAARVGACDIGAFEFGGSAPGWEPPATPSLQALEVSGPALKARWGAVGGAARYELELRAARSQAVELRAVPADRSGHTMVVARGDYTLRLRACNAAGCSGFSEARGATVTSDPALLHLPLLRR